MHACTVLCFVLASQLCLKLFNTTSSVEHGNSSCVQVCGDAMRATNSLSEEDWS